MEPDLLLRPATPADLEAVAGVHLAARRHAGHQFPDAVHTGSEVRDWVAGWDLTSHLVWIAERRDVVAGYVRFTPTWLDDLYVHPDHQRLGIGTALLELVKARLPDGFGLWVFESNSDARDFYLSQGLVALERTDGSDNEEHAPDVRMAWAGPDAMAGFRRLIDEVDDELGELLARRAALTRVVQQHKLRSAPGNARDAAREAQVTARVASRAPELGPERVGRIMHLVISESIEAANASRTAGDDAR